MTDCIDCGKVIDNEHIGVTMCNLCVAKREASLTNKERMAMAKVGLDALIDEATGYENIRPKGDLKKRHKGYENHSQSV